MAKLLNKFEVGCDPEWVMLRKPNNGLVCVKGRLAQQGPVGYDHNGYVLELRPEPARGTYTVLSRLATLLNSEALSKFTEHKWRAGAYVPDPDGSHGGSVTLGGHIHFSLTKDEFSKEMAGALDSVNQLLETLEILPQAECVERRKGGYGKKSQIRSDWPDKHVEYRTFASWLHNPNVAFMVLTLAKLAVVSPEDAIPLESKTSIVALRNFVEKFATQDINAARLLHKLEKPGWMKTPPDAEMKGEWKCSFK